MAIPLGLAVVQNPRWLNPISEADMADPERPSPEPSPIDSAFSALYGELKRLARAQRRRHDTLNTTALVHDLYLSLAAHRELDLADPVRFYAYAAKAMRHLLIDRARARSRLKAGGDQTAIAWTDAEQSGFEPLLESPERALELDSALSALAAEDARAAEIVEWYLFGGLTIERIAEIRGLSTRTVDRDWRFARSFLKQALSP